MAHPHFLGVLDERSSLQCTQSLQRERVSGQDLAAAFAGAKLEREMSSSVAAKPKISSAAAWTPTGGRAIMVRAPSDRQSKHYLEVHWRACASLRARLARTAARTARNSPTRWLTWSGWSRLTKATGAQMCLTRNSATPKTESVRVFVYLSYKLHVLS